MKVMAGERLPHFHPALLDSCKPALIYGLLMLLVCHALNLLRPDGNGNAIRHSGSHSGVKN
jgi:hypothetical protein